MSVIDDRIVEMRFDNRQFLTGVAESIKALTSLKMSLNLQESSKSLQDVAESAKGLNLDAIINAAQVLTHRFSALGIIGDQIFRRLANTIYNLEMRFVGLAKSMSIDQISAGFDKYAQKTEAVQTIMNATGKSIDDVNDVLDRLLTYTDETSYSFTEMVNSIGKFTSAGVDLEVAERAMEGISNWAATAGVGPEKAASAFYNLSQAISAGAMKTIDWKSIQGLNMNTAQFKQTVIETTQAMIDSGQITDKQLIAAFKKADVTVQNFDTSLSNGWFSSQILLEVLGKYADQTTDFGLKAYKAAQEAKTFRDAIEATKDAVSTGWMNTFEALFGNYEEAKVLWTNFANELVGVFTAGAEARNELLTEWHEGGGYETVLQAISIAWRTIKDIAGQVKKVFDQLFPSMNSSQLLAASDKVKELAISFRRLFFFAHDPEETPVVAGMNKLEQVSARFDKPTEALKTLKNIFSGLFSIFDIGKSAISAVLRSLSPLVPILGKLGGKVFYASGSIGEWLTNLNKSIKENDTFYNAIQKAVTAFKNLLSTTTTVKDRFKKLIDTLKGFNIIQAIKKWIDALKTTVSGETFANGMKNIGSSIGNFFIDVFNKISQKAADLWPSIVKAIKGIKFENVLSIIGTGLAGGASIAIINAIKAIKDKLSNISGGGKISDFLDGLTSSLEELQNKLKASALMDIAKAVGILALSAFLLSSLDADALFASVAGIAALFGELVAAFNSLTGKNGIKAGSILMVAQAMKPMATAILILSLSMILLGSLSWDQIGKGLVSLAAMMGLLVGVSYGMSKTAGQLKKVAKGLVIFSVALAALSRVVRYLGDLPLNTIKQGLIGIGVLIGEVALFLKIGNFKDFGVGDGVGLLALAAAMHILISAVSKIGDMDVGVLKQGLIGAGVMLAMVGIFVNMASLADKVVSSAAAMLIVSIALKTLSKAIESIGGMDTNQLVSGMVAVGFAIAAMTTALLLLDDVSLKGSASILIMSVAIGLLAASLKVISTIDNILVVLAGLAGVFVILGVAAYALAPVSTIILTLSGSIFLISAAVLVGAVGLSLFAAAILGLAAAGTAGSYAFIASLSVLLDGIGTLGTTLVTALETVLIALTTALVNSTPVLVNGVLQVLVALLVAIRDYAPMIITLVIQIIVMLAGVIGQMVEPLVQAGVALIINFINGIANAIRDNSEPLWLAIGNLISALLEFIIDGLERIVGAIPGIGPKIVNGLEEVKGSIREALAPEEMTEIAESAVEGTAEGLESGIPALESAGSLLGGSITDAFSIDGLTAKGSEGVSDYATGMLDMTSFVESAGITVGESGIEGLDSLLSSYESSGASEGDSYCSGILSKQEDVKIAGQAMGTSGVTGTNQTTPMYNGVGQNVALGFISGMDDENSAVYRAAYRMGQTALSAVRDSIQSHSPSRAFMRLGEYSAEGMAIGMEDNVDMVSAASTMIANTALDSMKNTMEILNDLLSSDLESSPVITPVLDLTNVESGMAMLGRAFNKEQSIPINAENAPSRVSIDERALNLLKEFMAENQNGRMPVTVPITVNTNEFSNSQIDYLAKKVNKILGGAV